MVFSWRDPRNIPDSSSGCCVHPRRQSEASIRASRSVGWAKSRTESSPLLGGGESSSGKGRPSRTRGLLNLREAGIPSRLLLAAAACGGLRPNRLRAAGTRDVKRWDLERCAWIREGRDGSAIAGTKCESVVDLPFHTFVANQGYQDLSACSRPARMRPDEHQPETNLHPSQFLFVFFARVRWRTHRSF
jgi:hypothetical protein